MTRFRRDALLVIFTLVAAIVTSPGHCLTVQPIALTGSVFLYGPNTNRTTYFTGFSPPVINNSGHVAFMGNVAGPDIREHRTRSLWSTSHGRLLSVIRPEISGHDPHYQLLFRSDSGPPHLSDSGVILFEPYTANSPTETDRIWMYRPGDSARREEIANYPAGSVAHPYTIDALGNVVTMRVNYAQFIDPNLYRLRLVSDHVERQEVWRMSRSELATRWSTLELGELRVAPLGDLFAFSARARITSQIIESVIVRISGESTEVVAESFAEGLQGPGLGAGVTFRRQDFDPALSPSGSVAFAAEVQGVGINASNDAGLWLASDNGPQLVAREGQLLAGIDTQHARFHRFGRPAINASNMIAFRADGGPLGATESNRTGIWAYGDDGLQPIAINGNVNEFSPGTGLKFDVFSDPTINDLGMIVFEASLRQTGTNAELGNSIWAAFGGQLMSIVRSGDTIDIDPGPGLDLRVVDRALFHTGSGSGEGLPRSLSNSGLLAFGLEFTDGSQGIFTTQVRFVPEPNTCIALAMVAGYLFAGRFASRRCTSRA